MNSGDLEKMPCPIHNKEPDWYKIPSPKEGWEYPVYFPTCTDTQTDYHHRTFAIKVRIKIRHRYHIFTFLYMADFKEKKMKIKVLLARFGREGTDEMRKFACVSIPGFEDYAQTPQPRKKGSIKLLFSN